jgi:peptidoglycan/xylan/chitin deacetylase (PgdA/CDA1 family)
MNSKSLSFIFILLSIYLTNALPLYKRSCSKSHKVVKGDTCHKIWTKYGLSESKLRSLNPGISCSSLKIGASVCVGSGSVSYNSSCSSHYTVANGDTCYKIWSKYGLSESKLRSLNPGISCSSLKKGDKVCVAGGSNNNSGSSCKSHYTVGKGDTCYKIWTKYGINEATLRNLNPGLSCSSIRPGQELCVKNSSTSNNGNKGSPSSSFTWYKECNTPNTFAITFDDGPYKYDNDLLDLLKKKGVKATFFINGDNVSDIRNSSIRSIIKRMYNEGHNVLSHTWSHKDLTKVSDTKFRSELKLLEDQIYDIIGKRPKAIRPPYGSNNSKVINNLKYFGYSYGILWHVDTEDWSNLGNVSKIHNFVKKGLETSKSPIILNHSFYKDISREKLLKAVEDEIDYLKGKGFKGVNMETCIGHSVYISFGYVFQN